VFVVHDTPVRPGGREHVASEPIELLGDMMSIRDRYRPDAGASTS
jgi:hypothetical protein